MRADYRVTLAQIGPSALAAVGARDYVHDDADGMVMFRVGSDRTFRKVTVRLNGNDLYDIEYGHMPTRGARAFEWITDRTMTDVGAENLAESVRGITESE